jgi:Tfp pilus assembly protein PilO
MKRYWDNLRPLEKRLVAGIGVVVFILVNLWFVVPHFSDWGKVQARNAKAQLTLRTYQNEIAQKGTYERMLGVLEGEGQNVPQEEQSTHFSSIIQSQAMQAGVAIQDYGKQNSATNLFFLELSQTIRVQAREQQLVDFLYNLGSSNSLIRVRDLTLNPDQPRQNLLATIKLVATYQKKPAVRAAAPVATPAAKPGAAKAPAPAAKSPVPGKSTVPTKSGSAVPPPKTTPNRSANPANPPGSPGARSPATNKPGIFNSKRS